MTYIDQLKSAVAAGGICVNLGRSLESRHPELYRYCIEQTDFLNDGRKLKFNERVYCLIHGLTSRPLNARGEPARFENIHEGYILLNSIAKTRMAKQQRQQAQQQQAAQRAADALKAQQEEAAERARLGVPPIPTRQELKDLLSTDDEDLLAKADEHIRTWHKAAGKPLYVPGLTEGVDYIICPITGLRKSQIRRNYTENILGLTMAEYIECVGEDTPLICSGHGGKIAHGLHVVDEATGLTKSKISGMKTKERLSEVDLETGLTGYQKIGARTRATHMSKVDELGRNGYGRIAARAIIKGNLTKQAKGINIAEQDKPAFKHYKNLVHYLSRKNRGVLDVSNLGLAGRPGATQVDHKYSVKQGFMDKISPLVLGCYQNLEVLPWEENLGKHTECSITLEELYQQTGYTAERSRREYEAFAAAMETEMINSISACLLLEEIYNATRDTGEQQV